MEKQRLTEQLLATINAYLKKQVLLVSQCTMVDATIIHAPSSTKNKDKSREPDMYQTRKGKQWYFGIKINIGAGVNSGAVHTVTTTATHVADINELPKLLREDDRVILADAGYTSDEYRRGARHLGLRWCVINDKRKPGKNLSASQKKRNRKQSSFRARVEHVFRVIKQQFGFQKHPLSWLAKNASRVSLLVGLAKLYLPRRQLLAA